MIILSQVHTSVSDAEETMCTKWMVYGSFYPFMRNHNAKSETNQDPAVFSSDHHDKVRIALRLRYSLLPELHNLFFISHLEGNRIFGESNLSLLKAAPS